MFKNLGDKKKLQFLGAGVVLSLILIYLLVVSDTVAIVSDCGKKAEELRKSKEIDNSMRSIKLELGRIDKQIGEQRDTSRKVIDILLDHISRFCAERGCQIREIPPAAKAISNGYEVETNFITLEGSFGQLLDLVYLLEQKKKTGGHIASLLFFVTKNSQTKRQELFLTIYVQHFKKT